ncbi:MAG: hypothetical protein AABX02_03435, partial [archaeon]
GSGPGGFGGGDGIDFMNYCDEGSFDESGFIDTCVENESEHNPAEQMEKQAEIRCKIESKTMMGDLEEVCEEMEEGKNNCADNAARAERFAERQFNQCKNQISNIAAQVEEIVKPICIIERVREKRTKSFQLAEAKELEAIDKIAELSEYFTDETGDAVTGTVIDNLGNVAEVTQATEERDKKDNDDLFYRIGKMFGLNAQNEKEKANRFREQAFELRNSTRLLEKAGNGIQDERAYADLKEQITELESRATGLEDDAHTIEITGRGLFGEI